MGRFKVVLILTSPNEGDPDMITLNVKDMTCGHCVSTVTKAVQSLDAKATVQVDLPTGRVDVTSSVQPVQLIQAISDAGYPAALASPVAAAPARPAGGCCCAKS